MQTCITHSTITRKVISNTITNTVTLTALSNIYYIGLHNHKTKYNTHQLTMQFFDLGGGGS